MKHIDLALSQVGIKEITGKTDNPEVLKYFNELGYDGTKLHDETSWCSAFANWVCKRAGLPYTGKLTARSWLNVGERVYTPKMGDIAVFWRESPESWKGHVAFFIRETPNWVYVLGGNQSDQVKISAYPKFRLLEYRRLM
ncbi:MAG: TIGR02594 family protein [Tenacibaculum sp.]|nr:TIGR02594 family protein [Tenacibaculum sp.]